MTKGIVFSVEEFSVNDGPGMRSTVFLKGCPLRCSWCHNPEGQDYKRRIIRSENGCVHCGNCVRASETHGGVTVLTEKSIQNCPQNLIRFCGIEYDCESLEKLLLPNIPILNAAGGGVTFSGGEPLAQPDFLAECMERLRGKVNIALQTSGFASEDVFTRILALTDHVLFDIKLIDEAEHIRYTGVSNHPILRNFDILCRSGRDFTVRVPMIPTVTDRESNLESIARLLKMQGVTYAELLPYNTMAGAKYSLVGRQYEPDFDASVKVNPNTGIFRQYGINAVIM